MAKNVSAEILQQTNQGLGYPFKGGDDVWEIFASALNQRLATTPQPVPAEQPVGQGDTLGKTCSKCGHVHLSIVCSICGCDISGELIKPLEMQAAALASRSADGGEPWKCKARTANMGDIGPQDCDWPVCGCDPHADRVIQALQESTLYRDPRETRRLALEEAAKFCENDDWPKELQEEWLAYKGPLDKFLAMKIRALAKQEAAVGAQDWKDAEIYRLRLDFQRETLQTCKLLKLLDEVKHQVKTSLNHPENCVCQVCNLWPKVEQAHIWPAAPAGKSEEGL